MKNIIQVGIWVIVVNNWKILYWLRKSQHGEWSYSPPGGHLDYGETIEQCAIRELFEETWLVAKEEDVKLFCTMNEIWPNKEKHYVNIITIIKSFSWEVINKEPEKLEKWEWMTWEEVKILWSRNFLPIQNLIKKYPDFDPTK